MEQEKKSIGSFKSTLALSTTTATKNVGILCSQCAECRTKYYCTPYLTTKNPSCNVQRAIKQNLTEQNTHKTAICHTPYALRLTFNVCILFIC